LELELDAVPQREIGMSAYEIMLSESQERMLMVLRQGAEDKAQRIFEKWELDFAVIGKLTDTGRLVLRHDGDLAADMPIAPLSDASPEYDRPRTTPIAPPALDITSVAEELAPLEALKKLIACPDLASKRWVWEQYDHMVMSDTIRRPGGDAAVVRIHGTNRGLAITTDCTPRYCEADPRKGGAQAVAEAWRNLTSVGARPLAVTDCLNFGNPERAHVMGQFAGCIQGMGDACRALNFPVVSGNVSFYNETQNTTIQPTPEIGGVGLIENLDRVASLALSVEGRALVLIGETRGHLGASLYLREIAGREDGAPPPVDLVAERQNGDFVRSLIETGRISRCHDVSDGGLCVALAEMAMAGNIGVTLDLEHENLPLHALLFGEDQGRYVLQAPADETEQIFAEASAAGVPACQIGCTGGSDLTVNGDWTISIKQLRAANETWMPAYMAGREPEGDS